MIKKLIPEKLRNDKKAVAILAAGLLGMILLLLSCLLPQGGAGTGKNTKSTFSVRERDTEEKLAALLSSVKDVGKVKIVVTYDCMEEYEYARNEKQQGDQKIENDYVITDNGSADSGLMLLMTAPKVRGVAVCCEGASSAAVREEVTKLICAALGIGANRVYVTQMKN